MKRFLTLLLVLFVVFIIPAALFAQAAVPVDALDAELIKLLTKFPKAVAIYIVVSLAFKGFCAVAAMTKTDKDDKIAANVWLRRLLSLPVPQQPPANPEKK